MVRTTTFAGRPDDTFTDFKAGVIALGRAAFERAANDPESLAANPIVIDIANGRLKRHALRAESFGYAASDAYKLLSDGDHEAYWTALETRGNAAGPRPPGRGIGMVASELQATLNSYPSGYHGWPPCSLEQPRPRSRREGNPDARPSWPGSGDRAGAEVDERPRIVQLELIVRERPAQFTPDHLEALVLVADLLRVDVDQVRRDLVHAAADRLCDNVGMAAVLHAQPLGLGQAPWKATA